MAGSTHLSTWVTEDTKQRFAAIAHIEGLSESALLKRMITLMLQSTSLNQGGALDLAERVSRGARVTVRLPREDQLLLKERATARGMASATYASVLLRAHLRRLVPLPKEELLALKRVVAEIGAIGRSLNQMARALNQGERTAGPGREDLRAILRGCEGLRDHVKTLIKQNAASWSTGHAEAHD
jgi:predicted DNA binding CopG/RHH family protein